MLQSHPIFLTPKKLRRNAPLFVFLPGMDGTGQLLRAQTAGLEAGFDVRCLAIPPDDLNSWEALAQQVVDLIEQEIAGDEGRSVYLCGESFGGCLAMKVAVLTPHLFHRLILVNPASSFNRRPWITWGSSLSRYLPEVMYQLSSVTFLPLLASFGRIAPGDRQALIEAVRSVPQKTSIWRMSLLHQFQIPKSELQQLTQPVLLLASVDDRLFPSIPEAYRLKRTFQNAQVVVLPQSGHTCLLEAEVNLFEIMQAHGFLEDAVSDSQTDCCVETAPKRSMSNGL
jgi:pimeloyl-ACP methyl ester carboxylesterase